MAKETHHTVIEPAAPSPVFAALLPEGVSTAELRLADESALGPLEALLSPGERASIAGAVAKRRLEFAAGRACARRLLGSRGFGALELLPGRDRAPRWPAALVGSITHTQGYCAVAVADAGLIAGLGIDTEVAGAVGEDLWPRLFTGEEIGRLATLQAPQRAAAATLVFAAKEAFYKSQYPLTGQRLDFHDVAMRCDEFAPGMVGDGPLAASGTVEIEPQRPLLFFEGGPRSLSARYRIHDGFVSVAVWAMAVSNYRG